MITKIPHFKIHKAYMNGRIFKKGKEKFEIIEGSWNYINGNFVTVVRFKNIETQKGFEMEETKFFNKVTI